MSFDALRRSGDQGPEADPMAPLIFLFQVANVFAPRSLAG